MMQRISNNLHTECAIFGRGGVECAFCGNRQYLQICPFFRGFAAVLMTFEPILPDFQVPWSGSQMHPRRLDHDAGRCGAGRKCWNEAQNQCMPS